MGIQFIIIHINYHISYRILMLQVLYCTNDGRLTNPSIPLSLSYQKQKAGIDLR